MPFDRADSQVDDHSGVRIVWGAMDQDFYDYRAEFFMSWLDVLKQEVNPLFSTFRKAAEREDNYPNAKGSLEVNFDDKFTEEIKNR